MLAVPFTILLKVLPETSHPIQDEVDFSPLHPLDI